MGNLINLLTDTQFLFSIAISVAVAATLITLAMPFFADSELNVRKKKMAIERSKIREKERAKLMDGKHSLRKSNKSEAKPFIKNIVDYLGLKEKLIKHDTRHKLEMAGYRGEGAMVTYLFMRIVIPGVLFTLAVVYLFGVGRYDQPPMMRLAIALAVGGVGFYLPDMVVKSKIQKRQLSIRRTWPDAMDLMLICVESGMSIEQAFKKVADEIAMQSVPMAEELALTNAELSYLNDRRMAYENLGKRTGLESVKSVMTSLIQADRYGTPVGQALRVLAKESRDMRMADAEKKAAALPPKLTVPMILFFLPCLFVVIIGPAAIQVMGID
jgi:tight adherence protein C